MTSDNTETTAELPKITQLELDLIIKKHLNFVQCKAGGARAVIKFKSLYGLTFHKKDLSGADFTGCDLRDCDMQDGNFHNAVFYSCNLQNARMARGKFSRADFRGADLTGADMIDADLTKADLRQGAKIIAQDTTTKEKLPTLDGKTVFKGTDLENADLSDVRAAHVDLSQSNLANARMSHVDLSQANLENSNMAHVDLSQANLEQSRLSGVILTGAITTGASFEGAHLESVLTDAPEGKIFDYSEQDSPLVALLKNHALWVQFAGEKASAAIYQAMICAIFMI